MNDYAIPAKEAFALIDEPATCLFYEAVIDACVALGVERPRAGKLAANLVLQQLQRRANERSATNDIDTAPGVHTLGLAPATVASVAALREAGELSNQSLESLLDALIGAARDHGATAAPSPTAERDRVRATATTLGLLLVRDDAQTEKWIDQVLAANAKVADDVRSGKVAAAGRLVGEVMKLAAGKADAKSVRSMLLAKLGVKE